MNLSAFPFKNHYFNIGLEALQGLDNSCTGHSDIIVVVSLSQWTLKEVVSSPWIESLYSGRIVIIFHAQFLPLARYYQRKNKNIIAICQESESLKVLGALCRGLHAEQSDNLHQETHLTEKEFISLRYVLNGINAKEQAQVMGIGAKTAFTFRYKLAKKLQLKRLSHILFPFS